MFFDLCILHVVRGKAGSESHATLNICRFFKAYLFSLVPVLLSGILYRTVLWDIFQPVAIFVHV